MKANKKEPERGGDPFPDDANTYPLARRRRISRLLLPILLLASLGMSTYTVLGTTGRIPFPGSSLVSISASYALGSSPNSLVLSPGSNTSFVLTIQSFSTQTVRVSYEVGSSVGDRFSYRDTAGAVTLRDFSMQISGAITAPADGFNSANPRFSTCNCVIFDQAVSLIAGGTTNINGNLALSAASDPTAIPSFSISWFTSPA